MTVDNLTDFRGETVLLLAVSCSIRWGCMFQVFLFVFVFGTQANPLAFSCRCSRSHWVGSRPFSSHLYSPLSRVSSHLPALILQPAVISDLSPPPTTALGALARLLNLAVGGAMMNLKLELLESQMAKVSFNYTPSKDTKTGSIPSILFTLSRPSLSANFAIEEHPQINDWFSVPSPPD
jgi:hypothetical protein